MQRKGLPFIVPGAHSALRVTNPRAGPWLGSWQAFVKVVEAGSMAGAARALNCTRAQVSKQMAELEAAFGVRLLERSTRRLALTPAGQVFHQHALAALESVAAAELAVGNLGDEPAGVLRVSATLTFGRLYVAPLLPQLAAQHPRLSCELILTDQLVDLAEEQIDLALRMTRSPPEDAVVRRVVTLARGIFAAPAYLAAQDTPLHVADLVAHQTLSYLLTDGNRWRLIGPDGQEHTVPVTSRVRTNNTDGLLDLTLAGHGLAILPTYLTAPHVAAGRLRAVLPGYQPHTPFGDHVYACYTPSRARVPKVRVLLDALAAQFEPVPPWER
ncbi:LysR family transcriptional regulator [Ottowia sp. SB7-C50]|uniref:LysR family transcriptional regulator n=1 Tax=Ottowia sp. SB7-C50 TaxID=3081231 RepID=UPI002955A3F2|nr:LysR family transcriptional regulator [Ottowia sp. SB7-C50]WOP14425.1 LysR family transcriptional regulator [Ottowia sp. SB7-C50]